LPIIKGLSHPILLTELGIVGVHAILVAPHPENTTKAIGNKIYSFSSFMYFILLSLILNLTHHHSRKISKNQANSMI